MPKKRGQSRRRRRRKLSIEDLDQETQHGEETLFEEADLDDDLVHDNFVAEEVMRELGIPFK